MIFNIIDLSKFLVYLFPPFCLSCEKLTSKSFLGTKYICRSCFNLIKIDFETFCPKCKIRKTLYGRFCFKCQSSNFIDGIISATTYANPILEDLIKNFKYRPLEELGKVIAQILILKIKKIKLNLNNSFLVPVPISSERLKERGFNQAEIICNFLARKYKKKVLNNLLIRKKFRKPQTEIEDKKERIKNVKDCFSLNPNFNIKKILKKRIFIIDDVFTTGATLNECAQILKEAGFKEIWGLTVAYAK